MFHLRAVVLGVLAALGLSFTATRAAAHGNLRTVENACVLKIGPDFIYFTGYQPAASRKKFCEELPGAGDTIFVFDYAQPEMREMTTDFRIVRNVGEEQEQARLEAVTVAYLPPKVYPNGTVNFEHVFDETGDYVGIVTVDGPHGEHWVSRFPFSVGRLYTSRTPYYMVAAAALLALMLFIWGKEIEKT
jgi:hypothetical protein